MNSGTANSQASLVAYFAKTPPPHKFRRPFRYRYGGPCYRSRYGQHPAPYGRGRFPPRYRNSPTNTRCYGCRRIGHLLRDGSQKRQQMSRFQNFIDLGEAAQEIMNSVDEEGSHANLDEIAEYMDAAESCIVDEQEELPEFSEWVNLLLKAIDETDTGTVHETIDITRNSQPSYHHAGLMNSIEDAFYLKYSLEELIQLQHSIANAVSSMKQVSRFMLTDTGALKSICSDKWLSDLKSTPVQSRQLSPNINRFRFAGHPVPPKLLACLIAKIKDINRNVHDIRQVVFILPSIPIPFLLGLQTQRALHFDVCLLEQNGSHCSTSRFRGYMYTVATRARTKGNENTPHVKRCIT